MRTQSEQKKMVNNMTLLKTYIEENGLKQVWLAKKLGIATQTFNNIVCGWYHPSPKLAAKIEELTGVDARELLGIPLKKKE